MWEFFGVVVKSLPVWFVMLLIVFIVVAGVCLLPRVRRDKQGKLYLFSRSYEFQKNRAKEHLTVVKGLCSQVEHLNEDVNAISKRVTSAELEALKQSFYLDPLPKDERLISGLKYIYNGRNGSVRKDVATFVKDNPDVYMDVIRRYPQWAMQDKG
jgi:outer membrane murein-binding lipoprotein Lpp